MPCDRSDPLSMLGKGQPPWTQSEKAESLAAREDRKWGMASEMAQWVKALATTKSDDLNFIPGPHMVEEANWLLQAVFLSPHPQYMCVYTHMHRCTQSKSLNK